MAIGMGREARHPKSLIDNNLHLSLAGEVIGNMQPGHFSNRLQKMC
jgi:hypothetical protein